MGDIYRVDFAGPVIRAIQNGTIPLHIADRLGQLAEGDLSRSPRRVGKPLMTPFDGRWSARIGDHRAIYKIDEHRRTVTIIAVRRRGDVYGVR